MNSSLHRFLDEDEWNLEVIGTFLEQDSSSVNEWMNEVGTPLHRVLKDLRRCSFEIVELLINHGADANIQFNGYSTPLHTALMKRQSAAVIRILLENGADASYQGQSENTTICQSFLFYTSDTVLRLLLNAGCPLNTCRRHNGSILLCAIQNEEILNKENLQLLIQCGFNLHEVDELGRSVLCHALEKVRTLRVIELLVAAGGSLRTCRQHVSPLLCVTQEPHQRRLLKADMIQMLLNHVESVSGKFDDPAPLQHALRYNSYETEVILLLLDRLQDVNIVDTESGNNLLHFALGNGGSMLGTIRVLVKRGVKVHVANKIGDTALHTAVRHPHNRTAIIRHLIKNNSPVNALNANGENPLMICVKYLQFIDTSQRDIFKWLFIAGARIGDISDSLMRRVIDRCDSHIYIQPKKKFEFCHMLIQCCFLQDPNFNLQLLIHGSHYHKELSRFGTSCLREIKILDSNVGQGGTFREFLCECSSHEVAADSSMDQEAAGCSMNQEAAGCSMNQEAAGCSMNQEAAGCSRNQEAAGCSRNQEAAGCSRNQEAEDCSTQEEKRYNFNRLLQVVAENKFPIYSEIIEGKCAMRCMDILQDLEVYTKRNSDKNESIILDYDGVCMVAGYLKDGDLLKFMLAFRKMDHPVCTTQAIKETSFKSKKGGARSKQSRKRRPRQKL